MGLITPRTQHPATANAGDSRMQLAGVGYVEPNQWSAGFPAVIGAAGTLTFPDEVQVTGYNSFMLCLSATGVAASFALNVLIRDPYAPAVTIATRAGAAAVAGTTTTIVTFGAFSLDSPNSVGDVWNLITIQLVNNTANNLTIATPRLLCGVR